MSDVSLPMPLRWPRLGPAALVPSLTLGLAAVSVVALGIGAVPVPVVDVLKVLLAQVGLVSGVDALHETVVWSVRLPRVLHGVLLGGALGTAGALVQGWFRNPLADPGLVGVSAGATLGAAASIVVASWGGLAWVPTTVATPVAAVLGGLVATFLVLRLGRVRGRIHVATVLLAGIALAALCGALVGLLVTWADDRAIQDLTFWTMGSLGGATWDRLTWMAPPLVLGMALSLGMIRALDALLLGEQTARGLGVDVASVGPKVAVLAATLTGVSVAACGQVGFIGLVAPHLVRLAVGPRHALVVPGSALAGGILVVLSDTLARSVVAPIELPIGVVTALIGGPVFLHLLPRAVRGLA